LKKSGVQLILLLRLLVSDQVTPFHRTMAIGSSSSAINHEVDDTARSWITRILMRYYEKQFSTLGNHCDQFGEGRRSLEGKSEPTLEWPNIQHLHHFLKCVFSSLQKSPRSKLFIDKMERKFLNDVHIGSDVIFVINVYVNLII